MTVFAIISQPNPNTQKLPAAITSVFPSAYLQVSDDVWLVAGQGTATDISNKLGITDGKNGSAIVVEIANYYGRASTEIWSWIKSMWEATSNG